MIAIFLILSFSASAVVRVNQGLAQQQLDELYHEYEGSQIMPLKWFQALEDAQSPQLLATTLNRYGVLTGSEISTNSKINPHRLPVGFTTVHDERTKPLYGDAKWVGINCAACHTSKFEVNGKDLLVEGGANQFDLNEFSHAIHRSVTATLADSAKFLRFKERVGNDDYRELSGYLEKFKQDFGSYLKRNKYVPSGMGAMRLGPERSDGLGMPNNESTCHLAELGDPTLRAQLINPKNCKTQTSFTGIPSLWGTFHDEYTHYAGTIHSSVGRNVGQASATFAKLWVTPGQNGEPVYQSSTSYQGLQRLEGLYQSLKAPEWSQLIHAGVVKPLNESLVAQGKKLFQEKNCMSCHNSDQTERNIPLIGRKFYKTQVTSLKEIDTDPARVMLDIEDKVELPLSLSEMYAKNFNITPGTEVLSFNYRSMVVRELIGNMFAGFTDREKLKAAHCRLPDREQRIVGYKARSLEGIIFTPPYLHNSSIPTLDDLFKPAHKRPVRFYVGCRKLDLAKGGLDCNSQSENAFLVDTSLPGGSNKGHEYGTDMTHSERQSMIEYIKSIRNPARPTMGICDH